jgi:hypothetical protein
MDDLFGFLFGGAIVLAILSFVIVFATTALLSLYVLLEQVLRGWWFLPAPLSWGLTAAVFIGLMHFACAESHAFRRPALRPILIAFAFAWLGLTWLVGLGAGDASQGIGQTTVRPTEPPRAHVPTQPIQWPESMLVATSDRPVDSAASSADASLPGAARPCETEKAFRTKIRRHPAFNPAADGQWHRRDHGADQHAGDRQHCPPGQGREHSLLLSLGRQRTTEQMIREL